MAKFMGYPFSLEEEHKGMVQKIIELCSFENLSKLEELFHTYDGCMSR